MRHDAEHEEALRRGRLIGRFLGVTARHFGLSVAELDACRVAARAEPEKALACYEAIARSLGKR